MSYYTIDTWTIKEVASAFNFKESSREETERKVVVPIFQRGLRWAPEKRRQFIDSLDQGFPFGSLLFAKQDGINKYSVVDGLQRGSTVCEYVLNPLAEDNMTGIENEVLNDIRKALFPENENESINKDIQTIILNYLYAVKRFDNVQVAKLAGMIYDSFPNAEDYRVCTEKIMEALDPFLKKRKEKYEKICSAKVPIVIYSGPQELLNEIFNRINKNGIPLNDYEIYSATWSQEKNTINNVAVIEKVIKKYWVLADAGYEIDGFDATKMRTEKQLTAFEYLFGLGKYWGEEFECLNFIKKNKDDDVNEVSFEIVDACVSKKKSIATLDKTLKKININKLQRRIEEAISFVSEAISFVGNFKGNTRKSKILHSKYQIVSMISYVFGEMYNVDNLDTQKDSWMKKEKEIRRKLLAHYVADIITGEWHDGGGAKVYAFTNEKRYEEEITMSRWETILDSYYQKQLQNKQNETISNPVNSDSVILNCVYLNLFSAKDQLSSKRFDIEHLATKEKMKKLMRQYEGLKLPVACIGNLCYLPEDINRGKKEKTIYEENQLSLPIETIEEKYSFTQEEDLSWLSKESAGMNEKEITEKYMQFIEKRFSIIKEKFLAVFE